MSDDIKYPQCPKCKCVIFDRKNLDEMEMADVQVHGCPECKKLVPKDFVPFWTQCDLDREKEKEKKSK